MPGGPLRLYRIFGYPKCPTVTKTAMSLRMLQKWLRLPPQRGCGAPSAARASTNTSALGPVPTHVSREGQTSSLGRPTCASLGAGW